MGGVYLFGRGLVVWFSFGGVGVEKVSVIMRSTGVRMRLGVGLFLVGVRGYFVSFLRIISRRFRYLCLRSFRFFR